MDRRTNRKSAVRLIVVFAIAMAMCCGNRDESRKLEKSNQFETVRSHIQTWLSEAGTDTIIMPSSQLKETILKDWINQRKDYQIVSVRKPDDYANAGHIPNAMNICWTNIITDENLAELDINKTLILYCYYGHASMISCTILSLQGYSCRSLNFGMMDWNLDVLVKTPWDQTVNYEMETAVYEPRESYTLPVILTDQADARSILLEMAREYFGGEGSPVIASSDVKAIVDNWDEKRVEFQIVDVRSIADYEIGHIPFSMNIPWMHIAETVHLRRLDPDRTVIVYSENGQTGEIAATVLNLLGYHAVDLKFGMMDWNSFYVDTSKQWDGAADYPVEI